MIPDCLDGIKSFSQNENQKLSDWLIASVLRHSKFSTCVNFNKISIIINSWWGASFQYYCYSKYSTWDKISEHQTNVHYYIWGRLLISKFCKNSHVVWKFLPEPVQNLYFNIFSLHKNSSKIPNEPEFWSENYLN